MGAGVGRALKGSPHARIARGRVAEDDLRCDGSGLAVVGRERVPRRARVRRLDRRAPRDDLQPPRRSEEDDVRVAGRGTDVRPGRAMIGRSEDVALGGAIHERARGHQHDRAKVAQGTGLER